MNKLKSITRYTLYTFLVAIFCTSCERSTNSIDYSVETDEMQNNYECSQQIESFIYET